MNVEVKEIDGVLTGMLNGRLDTAAAEQCREDLKPLFETSGKALALDCTNLEFISSSGLRIFLELLKKATRDGGSLKVLNPNDDVRNIFQLIGFAKRFSL
ncbi:MAG: STAS domain-containing protein [Prevotellaceae bacterium]|nr:STAS domain-containing protein [Candidatus Colivivens caballi]